MKSAMKPSSTERLLVEAELAADRDGRGFIKYGSYWFKVRLGPAGFAYSASPGHIYASREELLADVEALIGANRVIACSVCRRVRPAYRRGIVCPTCFAGMLARL